MNAIAPLAALCLILTGHPWLALATLVTAHSLFLIPTLIPQNAWCGPVLTQLPASTSGFVWITIDDGPDPIDTPILLDLLDTHHAKATFFFIGAKARQYPHLVEEVIRRGHTLGNHTMTHPQYWFWCYPPHLLRREIIDCQKTLTALAPDHPPSFFRAPAGFKNPFIHAILKQQNLTLACWNARGLDGTERDPDKILTRLKSQIRPSSIILLHESRLDLDGNRLAPNVLAQLLKHLKDQKLLSQLPAS
ncbi:polysaccharide deacetylase family protein [Phragmitibacter flavus]|uniref:Polysaccharide deacetylase family protein n=1 Tax=Phragmitibacter flavus TaxID=2576071 RepID=A0A5R8K7L7_9BACT|nr:polysaccharide deacetylase family protein [Phragmitibacter flavus]TLD68344.1 polysaccharide deacetylase family protein [Phragmitibacter flavus]